MPKRPLTAAEKAAYRDLSRAVAKLRRAQEAAERKRLKLQTAAELEAEQRNAQRGQGVADSNATTTATHLPSGRQPQASRQSCWHPGRRPSPIISGIKHGSKWAWL